ncbi:hypothetical protein [Lysobacter gummosus]|uniref:hypothetical protein n=1 Tax=Lysobacter gummosus TaxID=262324 RepID=UPI003645A693
MRSCWRRADCMRNWRSCSSSTERSRPIRLPALPARTTAAPWNLRLARRQQHWRDVLAKAPAVRRVGAATRR